MGAACRDQGGESVGGARKSIENDIGGGKRISQSNKIRAKSKIYEQHLK